MNELRQTARRWTLKAVIAAALAVVFLMYFQAELVMDLGNLLWRCA